MQALFFAMMSVGKWSDRKGWLANCNDLDLYLAISFSDTPRGKGLGKYMIQSVIDILESRHIDELVARVDTTNNFSHQCLKKAGESRGWGIEWVSEMGMRLNHTLQEEGGGVVLQ